MHRNQKRVFKHNKYAIKKKSIKVEKPLLLKK